MKRRSFPAAWLVLLGMGLFPLSCGPLGPDITAQSSGDHPVLSSAVPLSSTSVRLDWQDRSVGEDGFGVERREAGEQGATVGDFILQKVVGPNTGNYVDEGLVPETTYYYRVYYFKGEEKSRYSNIVTVDTPA